MIQKTAKFGVFTLPSSLTSTSTFPTTTYTNTTSNTTSSNGSSKMTMSSKRFHPALDIPDTMPVLKNFDEIGSRVDLRGLTRPEDVFTALYSHYTSEHTYSISLQERKYINTNKSNPLYKANSLTYGEINDLQCLRNVFAYLTEQGLMPSQPNTATFYDLGSGSGRVIIAASLLFPFAKCIGIEILASLHGIAKIVKDEYDHFFASPVLEVYHGSITDLTVHDWTHGDIIYVNSVCFSAELFTEMTKLAMQMKIGSIVITLAQPLPKSSGFHLLHETREEMSWGKADFLIQQKIK